MNNEVQGLLYLEGPDFFSRIRIETYVGPVNLVFPYSILNPYLISLIIRYFIQPGYTYALSFFTTFLNESGARMEKTEVNKLLLTKSANADSLSTFLFNNIVNQSQCLIYIEIVKIIEGGSGFCTHPSKVD